MRIHGQVQLGVEPPFVNPMSWLPPLAPAACGCTLMWLASIINHSQSTSVTNCSNNFSHIRVSRQRMNRLWVFFQSPYSGGRSRHGAPVRNIQNTALMKVRLSFATPPHLPSRPGRWGSSNPHVRSVMSCLRSAGVIINNRPIVAGRLSYHILETRDDTI